MNSRTVTIYHRNDRDRFMEATFGEPTYELAYTYQADTSGIGPWTAAFVMATALGDADAVGPHPLETIWRANNRVDGSSVEVLPDTARSLSVGDMVAFGGKFWTVANFGFDQVTAEWAESHVKAKEEV